MKIRNTNELKQVMASKLLTWKLQHGLVARGRFNPLWTCHPDNWVASIFHMLFHRRGCA